MQVLIVDDMLDRQAELELAFMDKGFAVTSTGSPDVAESSIRHGLVDLLVTAERVDGKLTHSLALLAEWRNPLVATILLTPRTDADVDELYLLLPSLHCILAPDTSPRLLTRFAIASVAGVTRTGAPMVLEQRMRVGDAAAAPTFASTRSPEITAALEQVA